MKKVGKSISNGKGECFSKQQIALCIKRSNLNTFKMRKKILILGNHDAKGVYKKCFDVIYTGPPFITRGLYKCNFSIVPYMEVID